MESHSIMRILYSVIFFLIETHAQNDISLLWMDRDIHDINFGPTVEETHRDSWDVLHYPIDLSFCTSTAAGNVPNQTVAPPKGCLFDAVRLSYTTLASSVSDIRLAVIMEGTNQNIKLGTFRETQSPSIAAHRRKSSSSLGIITCNINEEFCLPQVDNVVAQTIGSPSIAIQFSQETNTPALTNSRLILQALVLFPPLIGGAVGEWTDSKTLKVAIAGAYLRDIIEARARGELIQVNVRNGDEWSDGKHMRDSDDGVRQIEFTIRPQVHGRMKVFTVDATSLIRTSRILEYDVHLCGDSLVPTEKKSPALKDRVSDLPTPAVSMRGILAVSGRDAIKVPQDAIPGMATGNWAMSFWIRLMSGPTGSYRSFFYKGSGASSQRTPSAWLLPDSNKLAIRVSTTSYHDVGTETLQEIPMDRWTFLTFVFKNTSQDNTTMYLSDGVTSRNGKGERLLTSKGGDDDNNYSISTYVDGKLDVSMTFSETVLGNDGMLHLFKDVSHDGPRTFVRDLIVWDAPLSADHVHSIYAADDGLPVRSVFHAGLHDLQTITVDERALDVGPTAPAVLNSPPLPMSPAPSLLDYLFRIPSRTAMGLATATGQQRQTSSNEDISRKLLQEAEEGRSTCSLSPAQRLDLLAESASHGSAEALFLWSMLLAFGAEEPGITCGISAASFAAPVEFDQQATTTLLSDQARATVGFLWAAEAGISKALFPLAITLLSGIGAGPLLITTGRNTFDHDALSIPSTPWPFAAARNQSVLHRVLAQAVSDAVERCRRPTAHISSRVDLAVGTSVLCPNLGSGGDDGDGVTRIAMGLLHVASALGEVEADAALAHRYQHGIAVQQHVETAAQYARHAVAVSAESYHRLGGQPVLESDRIDDDTEKDVDKGNTGNDDELILHQKIRAEEGDVLAMVATGDLYYYGARGLPRDQGEALRLYQLAAAAHDPMGLCGAAAMFLKGEGTEKNVSRAVELYNEAAALGSVKALNGLGYIYFYGDALPKNETRAFSYFISASEYGQDGDSFTNAAFCLSQGIGVEKDLSRAAQLYDTAARRFGAFAAINALGTIHLEGLGVVRSPAQALFFMNAAISVGPWAGWLRRGLDGYLLGSRGGVSVAARGMIDWSGREASQRSASLRRSLSSYAFASEFGRG